MVGKGIGIIAVVAGDNAAGRQTVAVAIAVFVFHTQGERTVFGGARVGMGRIVIAVAIAGGMPIAIEVGGFQGGYRIVAVAVTGGIAIAV